VFLLIIGWVPDGLILIPPEAFSIVEAGLIYKPSKRHSACIYVGANI
jgi:hypothetical protein